MSERQMIFRVAKNRDNPYVMINKKFLELPTLSYRSKGILTYILSKPDHWSLSVKDLVKHGKEGRDAVYSSINELIEYGYIQHICYRQSGKVTHYEYLVYEQPQMVPLEVADTIPLPDSPDTETSKKGKPVAQHPYPESPEIVQSPGAPEACLPPDNPDSEKPTQVIYDFSNELIKNNICSSGARCALFELWEEVFCTALREWEHKALLSVSSRCNLLRTICLIEEHHDVPSIQSPFAFVHSCVMKGGYEVPIKAAKTRHHQQKKNKESTLPKSVQRQREGKRVETELTKEELAEIRESINRKIRMLYDEGPGEIVAG